jgi:hypothetical protein
VKELMLGISAFIILIAIFFGKRAVAEGRELEKEVDSTEIVEDPRELKKRGYKPLINILRKTNSLRDPRPGAVIKDYKSKGYDVIICPTAYDIRGKNVVSECNSLWGKYRLRVIK